MTDLHTRAQEWLKHPKEYAPTSIVEGLLALKNEKENSVTWLKQVEALVQEVDDWRDKHRLQGEAHKVELLNQIRETAAAEAQRDAAERERDEAKALNREWFQAAIQQHLAPL